MTPAFTRFCAVLLVFTLAGESGTQAASFPRSHVHALEEFESQALGAALWRFVRPLGSKFASRTDRLAAQRLPAIEPEETPAVLTQDPQALSVAVRQLIQDLLIPQTPAQRLIGLAERLPRLSPEDRILFFHNLIWVADWPDISKLLLDILAPSSPMADDLREQFMDILQADATFDSFLVLKELTAGLPYATLVSLVENFHLEPKYERAAKTSVLALTDSAYAALIRETKAGNAHPIHRHNHLSRIYERLGDEHASFHMPFYDFLARMEQTLAVLENLMGGWIVTKDAKDHQSTSALMEDLKGISEDGTRVFMQASIQLKSFLDTLHKDSVELVHMLRYPIWLEEAYGTLLSYIPTDEAQAHLERAEQRRQELSTMKTNHLKKLGLLPDNFTAGFLVLLAFIGLSVWLEPAAFAPESLAFLALPPARLLKAA